MLAEIQTALNLVMVEKQRKRKANKMRKELSGIAVDTLVEYLDRIDKMIIEYSDVPIKAMNQYEVKDIAKLRCGYDMICQEIAEMRGTLEL